MNMNLSKRILSFVLTLALLMGNFPAAAFATEEEIPAPTEAVTEPAVTESMVMEPAETEPETIGETESAHIHSYEPVVTAPACAEKGYTTYTCDCGDSYVDSYVEATGHSCKNGICTICKYEPSTTLVITEFVNGTYSSNSLTSYPNTRLRHDPISVKAGDQCSFSLPDGWSGYICLAYRDQNWNYTPKAWVQKCTYTFPADMDAFVVMRKDDGSVISPEEYAGEIVFTRKEAIPDGGIQLQGYYQKEIDKTIESVKALIGDEPCLVFPMVSDIHYLESTEVPNSFDYCVANMKELAKEIDFDFIACLGDITEGDTTQEITSDRNAHIINGFTQLGVPYYQVIGNHDDNRYGDATFTHEQLYENYLSTIKDVVFDASSMHKTNYYKDFDDLGIRCIFLNANTNGAYGYSDETCDWFDEAIKTENGLIVFTHIPPIPSQNYGAKYGTDRGSTRIREACENADNFLIMFSGHNHYDLLVTEPFLSFTMNCQKFENQNGDPNLWAEGAVKPQRVAGTETEDCFDIVVVRPESGRIDLIRFGAGEDRFFLIESTHTHTYTPAVTAPTCTEQGYTTYTCECGDSYVDDYVDATGHNWFDGICTVCGRNLSNPDILSVVFHEDGSATNAVDGSLLQIFGDPSVAFRKEIGSNVGMFDGNDCYRFGGIDYSIIANGFTLEAYLLMPDAPQSGSVDLVSGQEIGGFGFEYKTDGKLYFYCNVNGTYKMPGCAVTPGEYAHLVGTFDGNTVKLYLNGVLVSQVAAKGTLTPPAEYARYLCIGADPYINDTCNRFMKGEVAEANLYSFTLTDSEVEYRNSLHHIHSYENGACALCGEADPDYHVPGDITGDGAVNNKDVTRLFRYLSGYDEEVVEAALDVNGDGEVNNKDLTRLFRYLSGYDVDTH